MSDSISTSKNTGDRESSKSGCPFHGSKTMLEGILAMSKQNPNPKCEQDIQEKNELYGYYKVISDKIFHHIQEVENGMDDFFGVRNDKYFDELLSSGDLISSLSKYFSDIKKQSDAFLDNFFEKYPPNDEFNTEKYQVTDRIKRSSANVHFVGLMYIYCFLEQYRARNGNYPVYNEKIVEDLLSQIKRFGMFMAGKLEMGMQMSFLRTIFSTPVELGLGTVIREGQIIFPAVDGGANGLLLSENNDYLVINTSTLPETYERLNIAIDSEHIPNTGELFGCPAFPKLLTDISKHTEKDFRKIFIRILAKS